MNIALRFLVFLALFLGVCENTFSSNPNPGSPFENVRRLAEEAIALYDKGDRSEEILWTLQEVLLRGQDWLDTSEEEELMAQVVARILPLRKELYDESDKELMFLMLYSNVSTVTKEKYTFGNIPGIYPDFKMIASDPYSSLKTAVHRMEEGDMKEAEKNLLILYYDTWYNNRHEELKYQVANKLGLYYLKMQMPERCYELLRSNKIDMESKNLIGRDYIENLVYMGLAEMRRFSTPIIGYVFLEVTSLLSKKNNIDLDEIAKEYTRVMSGPNQEKGRISSFIRDNDKNFYFLTEKERIIRWANIKKDWESLKSDYYSEGVPGTTDELLNAFQYEKQILLRSAIKMKDVLKKANDPEGVSMLDSLLTIKMEMTAPAAYGERYDKLYAKYQRIQKYLLHHPSIDTFGGCIYSPLTTYRVASQLQEGETFVDFGKVEKDGENIYVAILITMANPEGRIVELLSVKELRDFISLTESDDARNMVRQRYDNSFLYEKLWSPIEKTRMVKGKILYCPADELGVIMPDAIKVGEKYLGENHEFHLLSSAESLKNLRRGENYKPEGIISFCGIDYVGDREALIRIARNYGSDRPIKKNFLDDDDHFLPTVHIKTSLTPLGTKDDFLWLRELGKANDTQIGLWTGELANEYVFRQLSRYRGAINISTHAFNLPKEYSELGNHYVVDQFSRLVTVEPLTKNLLPLYRTGLFLSGAERSWTGRYFIDDIEDGIMNGEEISSLDLSGLELVTLMACGTGVGEVDEYEGIIGIRRALKMAGCGSMVTTAWNLDKEASMAYLKIFYTNLVKGEGISKSHRSAQLELIKRYEDPYYWALFQLID